MIEIVWKCCFGIRRGRGRSARGIGGLRCGGMLGCRRADDGVLSLDCMWNRQVLYSIGERIVSVRVYAAQPF